MPWSSSDKILWDKPIYPLVNLVDLGLICIDDYLHKLNKNQSACTVTYAWWTFCKESYDYFTMDRKKQKRQLVS